MRGGKGSDAFRRHLGTQPVEPGNFRSVEQAALYMIQLNQLADINYREYLDDGSEEGAERWENVQELRRLALEYSTRTHHSNMDVLDHISADDLKQAAVIMATFVYNAAMTDEKLPRKPFPPPAKSSSK